MFYHQTTAQNRDADRVPSLDGDPTTPDAAVGSRLGDVYCACEAGRQRRWDDGVIAQVNGKACVTGLPGPLANVGGWVAKEERGQQAVTPKENDGAREGVV